MKKRHLLMLPLFLSGCFGLTVSKPEASKPIIVRKSSTQDAEALTPDQAKVLLLSQAANVDSAGSESPSAASKEFILNVNVVYELYQVSDGWCVFCHGPDATHGNSVHVDKMWSVGKVRSVRRSELFGESNRDSR